ncbi:MAG: hypothetical protein CVT64_05155 [Actinobacteria bacterium HGW-Actinobacteria-4]|nr:MAG: hypothetical protein CVT64_05155 [Actinobacteria bacterium HGW-Actinobacteria-4]
MSVTWEATVRLDGKTATGIVVPEHVVAELGGGRRIAVQVGIGSVTYPSTIAYMGGVAKVPVSAQVREDAGIAAGDTVMVTLTPDTAPRTVDVPADLVRALAEKPGCADRFGALSYSNQRRHVLAVTGARTAETRGRRIEKVVAEMSES